MLPQTVLSRFGKKELESVVWQTAAGGFGGNFRTGRACSNRTPDTVAAVERGWLQKAGVAYFDYAGLTSAYAPQLPNGLPDPHASVLKIPALFIVSRLIREKLEQKMPVKIRYLAT